MDAVPGGGPVYMPLVPVIRGIEFEPVPVGVVVFEVVVVLVVPLLSSRELVNGDVGPPEVILLVASPVPVGPPEMTITEL